MPALNAVLPVAVSFETNCQNILLINFPLLPSSNENDLFSWSRALLLVTLTEDFTLHDLNDVLLVSVLVAQCTFSITKSCLFVQ